MKAFIVSHKFNPGHLSHMVANFCLLRDAGYSVFFIWNERFNNFSNGAYNSRCASLRDLRGIEKDDLLIVWFPSIRALIDMVFVRLIAKGRVVYVFHEPFDSFRSYYKAGFGLRKIAKICFVSIINFLLVYFSHKIVLPSDSAFSSYNSKYLLLRSSVTIPLMFDDEMVASKSELPRRYISYIGTIAADHAFDEFVRFASDSLVKNRYPLHTFLIATSSNVPEFAIKELSEFVEGDRIKIVSGKPMANDEINGYFKSSVLVWNAYRRSMQSGILPKAYMFGTPVITSSANRSEFFVNYHTGIEISSSYDLNEIAAATTAIIASFEKFSIAARRFFEKTFYYRASLEKFLNFVNSD